MRHLLYLGLLLASTSLAQAAPIEPGKPAGKDSADGECHGTTIDFFSSPDKAAARAKKDEKLLFVLHVSGNFENPDFT